MPTWDDVKNGLNERKQRLDTSTTNSQVEGIKMAINASIKRFADNAGISTDATKNQAQVDANANFNNLIQKEIEYKSLINDLTSSLKGFSNDADMKSRLQEIGTLGNDIRKLELELKNVKQDASTSSTRKAALDYPDTKVSWYQGFASAVGFSKPIHQFSITVLIGFGILLLILSGLMMKEVFGPGEQDYSHISNSEGMYSILQDSRMYSVLGAITLVFVVLGILSYKGYLGKSM
jgi:hypothetical protein